MRCDYFDAGRCRSCTLMGVRYADQLADTGAEVAAIVSDHVAPDAWLAPYPSRPHGFRNKAKLVVGGRPGALTLGILDGNRRGVDLRHCGLHEPGLRSAIRALAGVLDETGIAAYDIATRTGELKYALVTHSPDGELMVRLVLRTDRHVADIQAALPTMRSALPGLRVVSVNLHPEHKAVLEGEEEIVLTGQHELPIRLPGATLRLGVRSFFQTNTAVAAGLYAQATRWADEVAAQRALDLFCGIGGFALHLAAAGRRVHGVELSAPAVAAAQASATELGASRPDLGPVTFASGDASSVALHRADLIVVNPPRRGLGDLAGRINAAAAPHVVYSSCNATSLARDLDALSGYRVAAARLFDMFPQSRHSEVMVRLDRRRA